MSERLTVVLDDGVSNLLLSLAGSSRKQGEFLSKLIRATHAGELEFRAATDLEQLRFSFSGLAGKQKEIEGRVLQIERQLAAVIADRP